MIQNTQNIERLGDRTLLSGICNAITHEVSENVFVNQHNNNYQSVTNCVEVYMFKLSVWKGTSQYLD